MDALTSLLNAPRAQGAFLLRAVFEPPWAVRIEDEAPLTVVATVSGEVWVLLDGGREFAVRPGDVAIMRGPDPYTVAGDRVTVPQVVIHPGQRCTTPDGEDLHDAMHLGVRMWGNSPQGTTVMLIGTYQMRAATSQRLLSALPPALVVAHEHGDSPLISVLDHEIVKDEPGQDVVLDRMLDLLLIAVLRAWFSRPDARGPAWYQAHSDPTVGTTLRLLHDNPALPWTVASLAAKAGVSRAALARRFTQLVGEPPMAYLTGWRLALAADLLREPGATLTWVARQVGYSTPYALSAAFKRVRGVSPHQHRTTT